MKRGYYYYCYYDQASRVMSFICREMCLIDSHIIKNRISYNIFVSTCRRRIVARSAESDLRDPTIGAVTPTKARANGKRASNNSAKPSSLK